MNIIADSKNNFHDNIDTDNECNASQIVLNLKTMYRDIFEKADYLGLLNTNNKLKIMNRLTTYADILTSTKKYYAHFDILKYMGTQENDNHIMEKFNYNNFDCKLIDDKNCKIIALKKMMIHYKIDNHNLVQTDDNIIIENEHFDIIRHLFNYRGKNMKFRWEFIKFIVHQINILISPDLIIINNKTIRNNKLTQRITTYEFNDNVVQTHLDLYSIRAGSIIITDQFID